MTIIGRPAPVLSGADRRDYPGPAQRSIINQEYPETVRESSPQPPSPQVSPSGVPLVQYAVPDTAVVLRRKPVRPTGVNSPAHFQKTRVQPRVVGDVAGIRNKVYDSDFYHVGKPFDMPGVHKNVYTAIPQQQSIMERFFGFVRPKIALPKAIAIPRGHLTPIGTDVNVDKPGVMTFGDYVTYSGRNSDVIYGPLRRV